MLQESDIQYYNEAQASDTGLRRASQVEQLRRSIGEKESPSDHDIILFIKAGSDRTSIGCDAFSQRFFMVLWLKGIPFNVRTIDRDTAPKDRELLREIAPGTSPPFLLFNGEVLTDIIKIGEFLEAELCPPRYPSLAPVHRESALAGNDCFQKFSAWVKQNNTAPGSQTTSNNGNAAETRFFKSLKNLDHFLTKPLNYEKEPINQQTGSSKRPFLDGQDLTMPDCIMLPKLYIMVTAGKLRKNWHLTEEEYPGIFRYLEAAKTRKEFIESCAEESEVDFAYGGRGKRPSKRGSVVQLGTGSSSSVSSFTSARF